MAKFEKVDPPGRQKLKDLDEVQRIARERGKEPLSKETTGKILDKIIKPAK